MRSFNQFLGESTVSLQKSKTLRSELFNTKTSTLKPEVRKQVLKIAEFWREKVNIPKSAVKRVDLVGSSVNCVAWRVKTLACNIFITRLKAISISI